LPILAKIHKKQLKGNIHAMGQIKTSSANGKGSSEEISKTA
jgi:hypothetical protein